MKKYIAALFAVCSFLAAACSSEPFAGPEGFFVEKSSFSIDYEGGSCSIVITTQAQWTVEAEQNYDWMTINRTSGKGTGDVLLTFSRNEGDERTAVLTVTASGYDPVTVNITQEALKSDMRLGKPYMDDTPLLGVADAIRVKIPYYSALGSETVLFRVSFSGVGAAGLEPVTVSCSDFSAGDGTATLQIPGTPAALGPVTVTLEAFGDELEAFQVRVSENITHSKYINWNNWSIGYTRSDFNLLRGSAYDYSWTSEAVNKTGSGVGEDHKALPSGTNLPGCEGAYLSLVCANPIYAAGEASGPTGTPAGLAGYQFNPGYQIQGMVQDDYVYCYIPSVSIPAGGKITVESSLGGATAAACAFIVEYSSDNVAWVPFDGVKTVSIEGSDYQYHFNYLASNSGMRYLYARDESVDPAYAKLSVSVSSAINGPLRVRLRASGLNGRLEKQTGTGWSDIKYLDIYFD